MPLSKSGFGIGYGCAALSIFSTLAASFHLARILEFHRIYLEDEYLIHISGSFPNSSDSLMPVLPRHSGAVLDGYVRRKSRMVPSRCLDVSRHDPARIKIGEKITDFMRLLWNERAEKSSIEQSGVPWSIYKFRTSAPYQMLLGFSKRHLLPFVAAVLLLWAGLTASSHFLFNVFDSTGTFCRRVRKTRLRLLTRLGRSSNQ